MVVLDLELHPLNATTKHNRSGGTSFTPPERTLATHIRSRSTLLETMRHFWSSMEIFKKPKHCFATHWEKSIPLTVSLNL
jgi:hypothetical protein